MPRASSERWSTRARSPASSSALLQCRSQDSRQAIRSLFAPIPTSPRPLNFPAVSGFFPKPFSSTGRKEHMICACGLRPSLDLCTARSTTKPFDTSSSLHQVRTASICSSRSSSTGSAIVNSLASCESDLFSVASTVFQRSSLWTLARALSVSGFSQSGHFSGAIGGFRHRRHQFAWYHLTEGVFGPSSNDLRL